jgi:hypothetical protein
MVGPRTHPVHRITEIATRRSLMDFPGNCASPKETAKWLASVAEDEFGLPGILPVMTVAVELTTALTSEGCLDDIPGYLSAVDHASLGLFQQQPPWWGTPEEIVDPDHAVRAFCREAAKYKDWNWNTLSADELGRWCAMVQNPREDLRDLYAQKGYPLAKALLEEEEVVTEWPERKIGISSDDWAFDYETGAWLRSPKPDEEYLTDKDGWLYLIRKAEEWEWPEDIQPVGWLGDGSYVDYHPSRWDTVWRTDIETVARRVVNEFGCSANTYVRHPPGWDRDSTSVDFWDAQGRGYAIGHNLGQQVFDYIFNDPNPPWIEWCIWEGWLWTSAGGWEPFQDDGTGLHFDHSHWTFW